MPSRRKRKLDKEMVRVAAERYAKGETMAELAESGYHTEVREVEADLFGVGVRPGVGVGQRALIVRTRAGNLLWDPPAFIDPPAIDAVRELGGLAAVSSTWKNPGLHWSPVDS